MGKPHGKTAWGNHKGKPHGLKHKHKHASHGTDRAETATGTRHECSPQAFVTNNRLVVGIVTRRIVVVVVAMSLLPLS